MIHRNDLMDVVKGYDSEQLTLGMIASHSALDGCDGAVDEGFRSLAVCQRGREKTYANYFKSKWEMGQRVRGFVDEVLLLERFRDVLELQHQQYLREKNTLFIPNRSFTSYASMDAIENDFLVPMVGSRNMLRSEERGEQQDYYWLLEKAGIPFPEKIDDPQDIDCLVMVKLHHKEKKLERGFFSAASYNEYLEKFENLLKGGIITREDLDQARIERYVVGPVFNFDFFYSPIEKEMEPVELLGIDWRFETSLDGHVRLPAPQQMTLVGDQVLPEYTVCGHNSATLRESLLERVFPMAERFVEASKAHYEPGIIGPFCLQTCVDKDLNFFVYDVAPRIGGGTNVHLSVGHPYGNSLWRRPMSTGRRVALEVKRALEADRLMDIIT
ncbi:MAG TPA: formate--phosphoribosylaminoimidazolecarboxamide ligase family protein [Euryarchaeota archaeon]|nr:formate--phosphoribosylaminoimidazolecarboxamide ligase family protein [Euryarchaeota archaeon]